MLVIHIKDHSTYQTFFEGKRKPLLRTSKDMMRAAKAYRFEDAQLCKKKILHLNILTMWHC